MLVRLPFDVSGPHRVRSLVEYSLQEVSGGRSSAHGGGSHLGRMRWVMIADE